MNDFEYKKYCLQQLDNWVNDALSCEDITPQEIYDTIKQCIVDSQVYHKKQKSRSYELLSLLMGHRPVDLEPKTNDLYEEVKKTYDEMRHDGWEMTADGFWWKEPISNVTDKP